MKGLVKIKTSSEYLSRQRKGFKIGKRLSELWNKRKATNIKKNKTSNND